MSQEFGGALRLEQTTIPGLLVVRLPVHGDNRGWFKENWQRSKMTELGFPDFGPVQNNVSFNDAVGTTRGIHAEPWDKFVSVVHGRAFGAWVDLRAGGTFGTTFHCELDPGTAVFVPRGVGNSYQTLDANTVYSYLVNAHWRPDGDYAYLNLRDATAAIPWPISLDGVELSEKDKSHPFISDVVPIAPRRTLVIGAHGQLGRALRRRLGARDDLDFVSRPDFDLGDLASFTSRDWSEYCVIVNAAAYTQVDAAESESGRNSAWAVNAHGVAKLAQIASNNGLTLVHVSSDYVFDGSKQGAYSETDPVSPLGVYGQTKAAGDLAVGTLLRHYIVRTSWVIGDGGNFVRTMADLASRGVSPRVVADQIGRLSFADDLADAIVHLLESDAPFGTYNVTSDGVPQTWADIAREVFVACGRSAEDVVECTTEEYFAGASKPVAPRPKNSVLDLGKIAASGFVVRDGRRALRDYLGTIVHS